MWPTPLDVDTGHRDYFTGVVIHGYNGDELIPLSSDAGGNLSALLKAQYLGVPTIIKCDADGGINVNVTGNNGIVVVEPNPTSTNFPVDIKAQTGVLSVRPDSSNPIFRTSEQTPLTQIKIEPLANSTIFKTAEQTPLTEIKVKSSAGAANIPVDIVAQTGGALNVRSIPLACVRFQSSLNATASTESQLFTFTGAGSVLCFSILVSGTGVINSDSLKLYIDGVSFTTGYFIDTVSGVRLDDYCGCIRASCFDNVLFRYRFILHEHLFFNTSFSIGYVEAQARTPNIETTVLYITR